MFYLELIKLSLKNSAQGKSRPKTSWVIGWLSVCCGVGGLYSSAVVLGPLCFFLSLISILMGEFGLGVIGFLLAIIGLIVSPSLLFFLGKELLLILMSGGDFLEIFQDAPPKTGREV